MGFPDHLLLAWGGSMGTSDETWSCSLRLTSGGYQGAPQAARAQYCRDLVPAAADAVAAYMTATGNVWSVAANFEWLKANPIDADGHYVGDSTIGVIYDTPRCHGANTTGPFQNSLVITLETGVQRGLAVAGRFFIPCGQMQPAPDGAISIDDANFHAGQAQTFIRAINSGVVGFDAFNIVPVVSVVSRGKKLAAGWGPGKEREVTGVAVGRVVDTQRRRRASLVEGWVHKDV